MYIHYTEVNAAAAERIVDIRTYLPKMYDKHSIERWDDTFYCTVLISNIYVYLGNRARRVSQQERNENGMADPCYSYGELHYEMFITIYEKIARAYGVHKGGVFFDLGSGVGQLVYAAAIIGEFKKCGGIEAIGALSDRGLKRMVRWEAYKENLTKEVRAVQFVWLNEDIVKTQVWHEATFIVLHWTAFGNDLKSTICQMLKACSEGTLIVTFTSPLPDNDFCLLVDDYCQASWGETTFFVHEKLTPRQKPNKQ